MWLGCLPFALLIASPWPLPSWAEAVQGVVLGFFMVEQAAKLALPPWKLRSFPSASTSPSCSASSPRTFFIHSVFVPLGSSAWELC